MKVGDLVTTVYSPDVGIVIAQTSIKWMVRVMWSNGRTGTHNFSGLEAL